MLEKKGVKCEVRQKEMRLIKREQYECYYRLRYEEKSMFLCRLFLDM